MKINNTTLDSTCKALELSESNIIATLSDGGTIELAFSGTQAAMQTLIVNALVADSSALLDIDTLIAQDA